MDYRKAIRWGHLASTVWFMLCTGYVFMLALRQAGFNWLVIFSLSGHWAVLVILLVSLYLFSIFRGAGKGHGIQIEHPLSSTAYYMVFYVSAPFLGAIAGLIGMPSELQTNQLLAGVTLGTIGATFLTWVVVDPITGSLELMTPQSRKHRNERLARAKHIKQQAHQRREELLSRILDKEKQNYQTWENVLASKATRLAQLLAMENADFTQAEREAITIGTEAWRMGGLSCMRQLRSMAANTFKQKYQDQQFVDYLPAWWDGIGRWRNPSLVQV